MRLSGAGAVAAARKFLAGLPLGLAPRRLTRAIAVQSDDQPLDDVLVALFPAPHSYTGETVVEVHCHGGLAVASAVQELAIPGRRATGPRPASSLNVRFTTARWICWRRRPYRPSSRQTDPARLESARANRRVAPLLRLMAGRVREALAGARGVLDYPLEAGPQPVAWREKAAGLAGKLERLLVSPPLEGAFREGVVVALLGPPNAGKSSLFNVLVGEDRALIDAEPGTTRDTQPCPLLLGGRRFTIVDTAGIREADGIEARAVGRSLEISRTANVVVWVEDISAPASDPPVEAELRVLAKNDLAPHESRLGAPVELEPAIRVSALSGEGISDLRQAIQAQAPNALAVLSARQKRLVEEAVGALSRMPETADDLAAEHLARAQEALASLAGTAGGQVDASEIYARLCVGN